MRKVNLALQIIPLTDSNKVFSIVDEAIGYIKNCGVKYQVTPFETVLEGNIDELLEIVKAVQLVCYNAGAEELITNIKIHSGNKKDIHVADKMANYESGSQKKL